MSKYAPKQWQSDRFDIQCPSGQLCLARKLQMEDIVRLGIIDEMDMFTEFAAEMGAAANEAKDSDASNLSIMKDKERFSKVVEIVDKVVSETVVEPKIVRPIKVDKKGRETALDQSEFEDGVVYTTYLDFTDKMHIFGTVFSGETIDQFREEPEEAL